MKNKFLVVVLVIIIIASIFGITSVMSSSKIKIDTFNSIITLDGNGDMSVKETWIVNYPAGMSVSFRDIGYKKNNPENPLYQSPLNTADFDEDSVSVEVFGSSGQPLSDNEYRVGYSFRGDRDELGDLIECYPTQQSCESIFVEVYEGMESQMTFNYYYTIEGVITEYNDTSEFNWRILDYFESGISSSTVVVNVPNSPQDTILAWGHGLSKGVVTPENNKVTYTMNKIKKGEFIEFRILTSTQAFSVDAKNNIDRSMKEEIISYEENLAEETNTRITIAEFVFYGTFVMITLMIFITYLAYIKYDKEHQPKFTGKYYRELPAEYSPAVMSYLYYFRKINDEDVTATLLDLIRRKYLILDTNNEGINTKNPDFKIVLNEKQDLNGLKLHEKHLINWFINSIGNNKEVTLKEIENYPKGSYQKAMNFSKQARQFVVKAKEEGAKYDFFEKKIGNQKTMLFSVAFIPMLYLLISFFTGARFLIDNTFSTIASIAVIIIYLGYVSSINKRSINGNEHYVKWKAFKDFMIDFGNIKDYPIPGVVVWEHYLVYATSLKIADQVMKQLEVRLPADEINTPSSTYMGFGYNYYGFHLGYTFGRINRSMTTARSNGTATIAAHNATRVGGAGRGGGFSGGSSFGGGGGGFRGR